MILQFLEPFKTIFYCFFSYSVLQKKSVGPFSASDDSLPILLFHHFFFSIACFLFSFKWILLNIIFPARDIILQSELKRWQKVRAAPVCALG